MILRAGLIALLFLAAPASTQAQPQYSGRNGQLDVAIPRIEASATIDGILDDAVWAQAAHLIDFNQYQPVDGRPASDPTDVLVWYAPDAIYFGIKATELHGDVVRATRANRDNIASEDHVQILLDTNNDNRIAFVFGVNALGVQEDGTRSDQFGGGAGGRSATGGGSRNINPLEGSLDLNPDFRFESAGQLTSDGYVVEIRIPFKSLRYQEGNVQDWGIHVLRRVQHSGFQDSWAPAVRGNASFLGQSGQLTGLTELKRGLVLDLTPTVTARAAGSRDVAGDWGYAEDAQVGGDIRWGIRQNLTFNGTINPDFSQVEADVGQVVLNERFALFFPEKRPFFLEGLELFDTPNQLIYTRQIVNPIVGAKMAGKVGKLNLASIVAADSKDFSNSGTDRPLFAIARVRRDLPRNGTLGGVFTTKEEGDSYSRLVGGDLRMYHSGKYYVELQAVQSQTKVGDETVSGPMLDATWDRTGRAWGFNYSAQAIAPGFRAAAGFVNRTGIVSMRGFNRLSAYGAPGALVETYGAFFGVSRLLDYDDVGGGPIEGSESISPSATLRGGWRLSGNVSREFYTFDPEDYAGYEVASGSGGVLPFQVPGMAENQMSGSIGFTTPTFKLFTASLSAARGQVPLFAEATEGLSKRYSAVLDLRPTSGLRASLQLTHLTLERDRDGSEFSREIIPRLKLEYQVTPAIFLRLIGQHASRQRSALRDSAGRPILFGGSAIDDAKSEQIQIDWLFSYRPNPGTLLYFGYGTTLEDVGQKRFQDLSRQADGFFAKLSYLFRV